MCACFLNLTREETLVIGLQAIEETQVGQSFTLSGFGDHLFSTV